jgi:uncharacterized repeat protein (TIGR04138 family)
MEQQKFCDVVDLIRKENPRFERRAYYFLRDALDHTVKTLKKAEQKSPEKRVSNHVTGPELLEGIREFALKQYGPMTHFVLTDWGIRGCSDFGEMVYQLIDYGVFSKTDEDSKEDFSEIYDFKDAFVVPFLSKKRLEADTKNAGLESN